ncbi:hypothetical protein Acsp06_29910 [Actinomycetospora sp. NBRC 106375]|uniref:hypothetical protein n=1 Tax=Actinomycetospora sp. NBRC 106375 TaxID=3032207 RepID=UPI0024A45B11|nr:hypothetical protein [Actinomycetospora sp. NBRC 106375]GLZ46806.1 hypothetical protein Acsp06_29910 [Actinomycetospora sp. NBRC 106375]
MTRLATWWALLPASAPVPPPGGAPGSERGEEFGKTSPMALVVIILLGIATALLIRSMNKQLRKVPASFDPPEQEDEGDGARSGDADGAAPSATSGRADGERTEGPPGTGSP